MVSRGWDILALSIPGEWSREARNNNEQMMVLTTNGDRSAHIWKANLSKLIIKDCVRAVLIIFK